MGWAVINWSSEHLYQPDGPEAGQRWVWSNEQVRFLLWWYALDSDGRFIYRRGVLRRMKGWGKDPFASAICLIEALAPCRFGGWDSSGQPIAIKHPAPWVQVTATNITQTGTSMSLLSAFVGGKDGALELGLDLGKEICYGPGSSRIQATTSSSRALEGARPTFVLMNETQHWLRSNEGHAMQSVILRNLAKSRDGSSRALALTNAHRPGENSVAEVDYLAHMKILAGKSKVTDLLYDSLEAPDGTDLADIESLIIGLEASRGDSTWLDIDRLAREIMDPASSSVDSERFYLNKLTAAVDSYISPQEWALCKAEEPVIVGPDEPCVLSFDGSRSRDVTGLLLTRVSDGFIKVLGVFDPKLKPDGLVDHREVDLVVRSAFSNYKIVAGFFDERFWESDIVTWENDFGKDLMMPATGTGGSRRGAALSWDMRLQSHQKEFTAGAERFLALVLARSIRHDGNVDLAEHMGNAVRRPNRWGFSITKTTVESLRRVDLAVCAVMGMIARDQVRSSGVVDRIKSPAKTYGF